MRLRAVAVIVIVAAATGTAASPRASQDATSPSVADVSRNIDTLSSFEYPTRMNAARMLRRAAPEVVVPALTNAARSHRDEFVRYRALVLLTSFNDKGTPELMRAMLGDRNDRVREVAYRWFERNPDPQLISSLLSALNVEQSEFVRPALVRAVAAAGGSDVVQRALIAEIGRGFDFFRSAVIEALGDYRATYAVDAIATVARADGPLQDDAVLALGRIGDPRGLTAVAALENPPRNVMPAVQAAHCLLGESCTPRVEWLIATARSPSTSAEVLRAAVAALGEVARRDAPSRMSLLQLAEGATQRLEQETALALSGVALRQPGEFVAFLIGLPASQRARAIELLRNGFESLEEDFAEEQFFAAARGAYWKQAEGSDERSVIATVIDTLEF